MNWTSGRAPNRFEQVLGIFLSFIAALISGLFSIILFIYPFVEEPNIYMFLAAFFFLALSIYSGKIFIRFCFTKPEKVERRGSELSVKNGLVYIFSGLILFVVIYIYMPTDQIIFKYLLLFACLNEILFGAFNIYLVKRRANSGS